MSDAAARAARVRSKAGWFALPDRGVIRVRGADRVRWTNGMVSNDVARLAPGAASSGCHALLLTAQGRILADLHVLAREDELWLELARDVLTEVVKHLERYVISDDVALSDASSDWRRFALEGPRAPALLARVVGAPVAIAPESGVELPVAAATVVACAWGWSGEAAYQLFVPAARGRCASRASSQTRAVPSSSTATPRCSRCCGSRRERRARAPSSASTCCPPRRAWSGAR